MAIEPETWLAFAILSGLPSDALTGEQVLVDQNGWLRARWEILATIAGHSLSDHTCPRCGMTIRAVEPIPCWHRDCPEPSPN